MGLQVCFSVTLPHSSQRQCRLAQWVFWSSCVFSNHSAVGQSCWQMSVRVQLWPSGASPHPIAEENQRFNELHLHVAQTDSRFFSIGVSNLRYLLGPNIHWGWVFTMNYTWKVKELPMLHLSEKSSPRFLKLGILKLKQLLKTLSCQRHGVSS